MAATLAEQLDAVQSAIEEVETSGQSISEDGQSYTRGDLRTLYAREERLLRMIDRADNGRRTVAEF